MRQFLSRLCGGEVVGLITLKDDGFLSRLCGGEVFLMASFTNLGFLSRLCGGEGCYSIWLPS